MCNSSILQNFTLFILAQNNAIKNLARNLHPKQEVLRLVVFFFTLNINFTPKVWFDLFGGGRGSNPEPCIYYVLSLSTELSSRGQVWFDLSSCKCFQI
jgi:hypothetical protein